MSSDLLASRTTRQNHFRLHHLPGLLTARVRWPEFMYLIDGKRRFIYCPIQKVACSSLMRWFLWVNGKTDQEIGRDEHTLVLDYQLRKLGPWQAASVLLDPNVFTFAFVRNPWARLVSAYLNLVMSVNDVSEPMLRDVQSRRQRSVPSPLQADVSCAEFVGYLERGNPRTFNVHWKPQHFFLEGNRFDFIGRFERLTEDFEVVRDRLKIPLALPCVNKTPYDDQRRNVGLLADWPPERLMQLPAYPDYEHFYTPAMRDTVARIYTRDIQAFGYEFGEPSR